MKKIQYIPIVVALFAVSACNSSSGSSNAPLPTAVPGVTAPGADGVAGGSNNPAVPGDNPVPASGGETSGAGSLGLKAGLKIDRSQFLQNLGNGIAGKAQNFRASAEQLNASSTAYCASFDPTLREDLKLRFRDAMLSWQQLELLQIGPLSENANTLKYKIYGWPQLSNYCKIDEEAMLAVSDSEYALPSNTNRKGLQALEYLIFDESLATICPSSNPTKAEWEALNTDQKWAARCAYLKPVAAELVSNAMLFESQWGPVGNNIIGRRIGNAVSEQSTLQELFNNLFYVDIELKNQKLAAAAGQDAKLCNKTPSPCPDKEELKYSHLSKEAMAANIRSLADIIFGFGEPRSGGLSALLRSEGGAAIADISEKNVTSLVELSEGQTSNFDTLLLAKQNEDCEITQNSWVCKLRQSIKTVVADFKGEYTSVLKTQVPVAPQGDND